MIRMPSDLLRLVTRRRTPCRVSVVATGRRRCRRHDGPPAATSRRCRAPASVPLIGYGLVIGLNKTGDRRQTMFSAQTLANMLERFGVSRARRANQGREHRGGAGDGGAAAFSRRGARLDVTASSMGDARSLQGGTLLPTPLRGIDGDDRRARAGPAVDRRLRRRQRRELGPGQPPHGRPRADRRRWSRSSGAALVPMAAPVL